MFGCSCGECDDGSMLQVGFGGVVANVGVGFVVCCVEAWGGCQVAGSVSSYGRKKGHVKDVVAHESSRVI